MKTSLNTSVMMRFALAFLMLNIITGCKKTDPPEEPPVVVENKPPSTFSVTMTKISSGFARIAWSQATDPENDKITYSVYLDEIKIADSITDSLSYTFENLDPEKDYTGYIIATDSKSNSTKVSFAFKTKKFYMKFSRIYGFSDEYTTGKSIIENGNGGYIVAGFNHEWELAVVNIDSSGNEIWRKAYPYINREKVILRRTEDGGYIIVGFRYILKISDEGNIQWDKVVEYPENDSQFWSIIQTADNGFLVTGTGIEASSAELQITLFKLDTDGNILWTRYYNRPEGDYYLLGAYGCDIEKSSDGNYILLGSAYTTNMHVYIVKVDPDGQLIWNKLITGGQYNIPQKIMRTSDNNLIILSNAISSTDINKPRVIKIDDNGNVLWDKFYMDEAISAKGFSICSASGGGYGITGEANIDFTYLYKAASYIIRIQSDGSPDWMKLYSMGDDFDYWWTGYDLLETPDKGFVMTGAKSWTDSPPDYDWGYWVLKTDPSGEFEY